MFSRGSGRVYYFVVGPPIIDIFYNGVDESDKDLNFPPENGIVLPAVNAGIFAYGDSHDPSRKMLESRIRGNICNLLFGIDDARGEIYESRINRSKRLSPTNPPIRQSAISILEISYFYCLKDIAKIQLELSAVRFARHRKALVLGLHAVAVVTALYGRTALPSPYREEDQLLFTCTALRQYIYISGNNFTNFDK
ncbi:hypothetical protein BDQ12DRAFT_670065 [Crucibulum laeve]|uniref:Uncharacterized protein n=1 Tax=Crucibulum laeve TaxID=68775 RepID=A0A5C3LKK0_9AGAR|nr:hypothetical protein BDQ12DRAFT_670065 [Crucibulum laeve]